MSPERSTSPKAVKQHFCTVCDRAYLTRALALYHSLARHASSFQLFVLCMDDFAAQIFGALELPSLHWISISDLETADPELRQVRMGRKRLEYSCTCKPSFMLYILAKFPEVVALTYVDADIFFFGSPWAIVEELGSDSILITEHRFWLAGEQEKYGTFNAGVIAFRSSGDGLTCLQWWRERCLEWCFDRQEGGLFTDQGYLEQWPARFHGVKICGHLGINAARWNVAGKEVKTVGDAVFIDGSPVVCFHFSGVTIIRPFLLDTRLIRRSGRPPWKATLHDIYFPYLRELRACTMRLGGKILDPPGRTSFVDLAGRGGLVAALPGFTTEIRLPGLAKAVRLGRRVKSALGRFLSR